MEPKEQPPPQVMVQQPGQPVTGQPTSQLAILTNFPAMLGPFPVMCVCPFCRATVSTRTVSSCNCCMYCLTGMWSTCYPALQDQQHFCPNCNQLIGMYQPDHQ